MGTRGLLGFITKGVRRGTYNHWDSYPSGLGDAIIKWILSHTDEELEEMRVKVEQLWWIYEDQVKRLKENTFLKLHIPSIPGCTLGCGDNYEPTKKSPAQQAKAFRSNHPGFPADISDHEILKRYLPAPFPTKVSSEFEALSWIPETGEVIMATHQHDLLERIWDGRQQFMVDNTDFAENGLFCEYTYWIDFENKVMKVDGIVWGSTIALPFKDMKIGVLDEIKEQHERAEEEELQARELRPQVVSKIQELDLGE